MANRTVKHALSIHGSNPQNLIGKILKNRIHESKYWKEQCTLLTSALVLEKAVDDLRYIGGTFGGNMKPSPFLCLVCKLLQIQPTREIIYLYLEQNDFKYLRALGAFYLRLVGSAIEIYTKLEPLLIDYRKLRVVDKEHTFDVIHMDVFIDNLLHEEEVFDIKLPRIPKRYVLEDIGDIAPYKSIFDEDDLRLAKIKGQIPSESVKDNKLQDQHRPRQDKIDSHSPHKYNSRRRDRSPSPHGKKYYSHHKTSESSSTSRDDYRRIERSRSPYDRKAQSRSTTAGNGRFKQEDIDNENSIRAKLGLRPLR